MSTIIKIKQTNTPPIFYLLMTPIDENYFKFII
jgi:hypothetical protein